MSINAAAAARGRGDGKGGPAVVHSNGRFDGPAAFHGRAGMGTNQNESQGSTSFPSPSDTPSCRRRIVVLLLRLLCLGTVSAVLYVTVWKFWLKGSLDKLLKRCDVADDGVDCPEGLSSGTALIAGAIALAALGVVVIGCLWLERVLGLTPQQDRARVSKSFSLKLNLLVAPLGSLLGLSGAVALSWLGTQGTVLVACVVAYVFLWSVAEVVIVGFDGASMFDSAVGSSLRASLLMDTVVALLLVHHADAHHTLRSEILGFRLDLTVAVVVGLRWASAWLGTIFVLCKSNADAGPLVAGLHGCSLLAASQALGLGGRRYESGYGMLRRVDEDDGSDDDEDQGPHADGGSGNTCSYMLSEGSIVNSLAAVVVQIVLVPFRIGILIGCHATMQSENETMPSKLDIAAWTGVALGGLVILFKLYQSASGTSNQVREEDGYTRLLDEDQQSGVVSEEKASIFSRFTFWWVTPVLSAANEKGRMEVSDIPVLPSYDSPSKLYASLLKLIKERHRLGKEPLSGTMMFAALMGRIQPWTFFTSLITGWIFLACMFIDPILLQRLLESSTSDNHSAASFRSNLFLVIALSASMWLRVGCMEVCYFASTRTMSNARSALVQAVYRGALNMPPNAAAQNGYDTGKVTNLVATDADEFAKSEWVVFFLAQWTWAVMSLPACVYFVYQLVGTAAFIGILMILFGAGLSFYVYKKILPVYLRVQVSRDERSRVMNGLIKTIKAIKLQMCEGLWRTRVEEARAKELDSIKSANYWGAFNQFTGTLAGLAVPVSIFTWYTVYEKRILDPTVAFTVLAWINQMQWSINTLPGMFNLYGQLTPSCTRLSNFLHSSTSWDQLDSDGLARSKGGVDAMDGKHKNGTDHKYSSFRNLDEKGGLDGKWAVALFDAEMGYVLKDSKRAVALYGVNLDIPKGELVIISGAVGSGKSTLLKSISHAMPLLKGRLKVQGSRAYVGQKPFLLNSTIEANVLFGRPKIDAEYKHALSASALGPDLDILPERDMTEVGDSGVQMSGGQKARIALARALYADADVYFFDDVLSAVDAHTGSVLWDTAVKYLLNRGKTIILATHQLQYISRPEVKRVLILKENRIYLNGPWKDILAKAGESVVKYVESGKRAKDSKGEGEDSKEKKQKDKAANSNDSKHGGTKKKPSKGSKDEEDETDPFEVQVSLGEVVAHLRRKLKRFQGRALDQRCMDQIAGQLTGDGAKSESRAHGLIAWTDFKVYLNAFGTPTTVILLILAAVACAVLGILSNVWLSIWAGRSHGGAQAEIDLLIYGCIGAVNAMMSAMSNVLLTLCSLVASRILHGLMLAGLLAADMAFFDGTPSGRIMNRFLQDLQSIDSFVPGALLQQLTRTLNLISMLSLVLIYAPFSAAALIIITPVYYKIFMKVRTAARDARRLAAAAHSPCYAHFSDTMAGRQTIHAFGVEKQFESRSIRLVKDMARKKYANNAVLKWSQALTTQAGCILYLACGITCVILLSNDGITTAEMGLVLLYAAQLQRSMMDYLTGLTSVETNFVSVERVAEYTRLHETDFDNAQDEVKATQVVSTPFQTAALAREGRRIGGKLSLKDVFMRYRLHKPYVLKGINLEIPPNAKVAVCGRTGCGKSTLFSVLARLYPISKGEICIDQTDISTLTLQQLRSTLQVVDQDAVLIKDSLRRNLLGASLVGDNAVTDEKDFHNHSSDAAVWRALEQSGLAARIRQLPGRLDFEVKDGGENFSAGERQLIALTRALLSAHKIRVLLCDEATAHVDLETDKKIHDAILGLDLTVLMICHRLQHIHRFDQVVVLDAGKVVEQGKPADLLERKGSYLNRLYEHANLSSKQT